MKKLLALLLTLALTLSLSVPALAAKPEEYAPFFPVTDAEEGTSEDLSAFLAWEARYIADHQAEYAGFDAEAFFARTFTRNLLIPYLEDPSYDKDDYLTQYPLGQGETFETRMRAWWLVPLWREAHGRQQVEAAGYRELTVPYWKMYDRPTLEAFLSETELTLTEYGTMIAWMEAYLADHPEEEAAFHADDYFAANLAYPPGNSSGKLNWFQYRSNRYGEEEFALEMKARWLEQLYRTWNQTNSADALAERYAADYAAFDADAWFAGYYGELLSATKPNFMKTESLPDEESFRKAMFAEWAGGGRCRFNGYVVTVDGVPIQFQLVNASPQSVHNRLMVPARAVAEALGFTVSYDPATRAVLCTKGETSLTFVLDHHEYTVTHGTQSETLALDVAPYATEDHRTYLPVRALGEALGCTVTWNSALQTAVLTTSP